MNDFQTFADNYSTANFDMIKFDWNGKHGDKLFDKNAEFRLQLIEFLIPKLETVKLELICDLYTESAKFWKEVWGVDNKFHLLAQQLLVRGGTKYLLDYMQGASLSMDTNLASGRVEISRELAQQILNHLKTTSDIQEKKLAERYIKRFEWFAAK